MQKHYGVWLPALTVTERARWWASHGLGCPVSEEEAEKIDECDLWREHADAPESLGARLEKAEEDASRVTVLTEILQSIQANIEDPWTAAIKEFLESGPGGDTEDFERILSRFL